MNIILLSGGSGKRLWPLSNDIRSKQFIKMFRNEEDELESMLTRVFRQITSVDPEARITIATSRKQASTIKNQLGERVNICVEPERRDTFPAICLASAYLHDELGVPEEEAVVVCPVDPYVQDSYFEALQRLAELAERGEANLTLMGIEPTYPSEKYGYIIPLTADPISTVSTFKEKPVEETAREYIAQGALWNGGVFAFKLGYLLKRAHELIEFDDYRDLFASYGRQKKISFDYAVVEQEKLIQVLRYNGEWLDLGSWNTFTEAMDSETIGKVTLDDHCKDTQVVNELNIPILCMGCQNMVVAASVDGILVSGKDRSAHIKPYGYFIPVSFLFHSCFLSISFLFPFCFLLFPFCYSFFSFSFAVRFLFGSCRIPLSFSGRLFHRHRHVVDGRAPVSFSLRINCQEGPLDYILSHGIVSGRPVIVIYNNISDMIFLRKLS